MRTSDFDYDLPRELIATHPANRRDESRLMVLDAKSGAIDHREFRSLMEYLRPGDLLVMNDSRVMKARLRGIRCDTGAAVEVLLLHAEAIGTDTCTWEAFCRPARKFRVGEKLKFANGSLLARVVEEGAEGQRTLEFLVSDIMPLLEQYGEIPLPPYIVQRRKESEEFQVINDAERYQTVYARDGASVAAPTAGLHFTPELLKAISQLGVREAWVTLNVGAGTFKPVEVDDPTEHPMHLEYFNVSEETAQLVAETKKAGGRIVAVGTTTVRSLESAFDPATGTLTTGSQSTRLLILPGYKFKVVDALITNFHLPRSSLMMMVSALAGHQNIMSAYEEAIAYKYRFYSYGDAMLIH